MQRSPKTKRAVSTCASKKKATTFEKIIVFYYQFNLYIDGVYQCIAFIWPIGKLPDDNNNIPSKGAASSAAFASLADYSGGSESSMQHSPGAKTADLSSGPRETNSNNLIADPRMGDSVPSSQTSNPGSPFWSVLSNSSGESLLFQLNNCYCCATISLIL